MKRNRTLNHHCLDCKLSIDDRAKRCRKHANLKSANTRQGKNHWHFIDGRSLREYYCIDCNKEITYTAIRCRSCAHKIIKHSIKTKKKISKAHKGLHHTEDTKKLMSLLKGGTGKPYEHKEYPKNFYELREQIRKRDNYICQKCNRTQKMEFQEFKIKLSIHHIDYNKMNSKKDNLITLCHRCNNKVNKNRNYYKKYFKNVIKSR